MMEHQNRRCLWEQIEEQEENIKDEFVSPIKELTYDEVTEPIEKNVTSYELSEMDWAEYLTHFTYLVEGLKDYRDECDNSFAGVMIDRFGKNVSMIRLDDKRFVVNVEVAVSRQFLAWIISLGEGVTLVGPDNVVEMMNIEIDRLIKQYKK